MLIKVGNGAKMNLRSQNKIYEKNSTKRFQLIFFDCRFKCLPTFTFLDMLDFFHDVSLTQNIDTKKHFKLQ